MKLIKITFGLILIISLLSVIAEITMAQDKTLIGEKNDPVKGKDPLITQDERPSPLLETKYEDGFCLKTIDSDWPSLCLGGLLQTDYRYFDYDAEDPEKNRFDLRRVRLRIGGSISPQFDYKFEYEFQGAGSRNLVDAYLDANFAHYASFRVGQFKEPFGLEQSTPDTGICFSERSMGYYLTPSRDVGFMAHGTLRNDSIHYGVGVFNGNGPDDSAGGDEDSPQFAGRMAIQPFKAVRASWKSPLDIHLGGSVSYAPIDKNNVDIHVKTAGLTEFFNVASNAKFNVIREAGKQIRYGAEAGCSYGPLALTGEYIQVFFKDVKTSSDQFDIQIDHYYMAFLWMLTGEAPAFQNGILRPIKPIKAAFGEGSGGIGLALRFDRFKADESVYDYLIIAGNSVGEAEASSIALNWYINSYIRFVLDYTRTSFDQPLLIDRDALTGLAIYSDREDVFTARFQVAF
jgi:phosphate-selective porin OprO/OprP